MCLLVLHDLMVFGLDVWLEEGLNVERGRGWEFGEFWGFGD